MPIQSALAATTSLSPTWPALQLPLTQGTCTLLVLVGLQPVMMVCGEGCRCLEQCEGWCNVGETGDARLRATTRGPCKLLIQCISVLGQVQADLNRTRQSWWWVCAKPCTHQHLAA
jgi:hypothetical protein